MSYYEAGKDMTTHAMSCTFPLEEGFFTAFRTFDYVTDCDIVFRISRDSRVYGIRL